MTEIVEKVARAIAEQNFSSRHRDRAVAAIRAFLDAAEQEGWQMVPKKATAEMIEAAVQGVLEYQAKHAPIRVDPENDPGWKEMLAAAPRFKLGDEG